MSCVMKQDFNEIRFPPPGRTPAEDTAAVMRFYKLPQAFPPAVLAEARAEFEKKAAPGYVCPIEEGAVPAIAGEKIE